MDITSILTIAADFLWGLPLIIMLLGTGIYLTFLLRGIQFTKLFYSLNLALVKRKENTAHAGDISHFQALMTALAATVGTGNIVGVATAISAGGPGAMFWMWVTGFLGMATKYSEAVLAVKFREIDKRGKMIGGPMFYIEKGLNSKWLAVLFAVFASIAAFGIGNMAQANSVADAVNSAFGIGRSLIGIVMLVLTFIVIMGGIKSIGRASSAIVPFMILFYVITGTIILIANYQMIPEAFRLIFYHAFNPTAAVGGFAGSTVRHAMRMGVARGIFSNESGLGSSPIAAAAAKTDEPVRQGLVSMTQTFIDTIIVCTFTGLVLLVTGVWSSGNTPASLTEKAFQHGFGGYGGMVVTISLAFFAYSTILGWSYYGEKSVEYLFGVRSIRPYRLVWVAFVYVGSVSRIDIIWIFSDVMNALMAFPNLIALVFLSGIVAAETKQYFSKNIEV